MAIKINDRDLGYDALLKEITQRAKENVEVVAGLVEGAAGANGLAGDDKHPGSKKTIAEIGAIHEYGWPEGGIDARPFVSTAADRSRQRWRRVFRAAMQAWAVGQITYKQALSNLGIQMAGDIKRRITAIKSPALKPATIRAKGRKLSRTRKSRRKAARGLTEFQAFESVDAGNPLIDTGAMRNAVHWDVRKRGI